MSFWNRTGEWEVEVLSVEGDEIHETWIGSTCQPPHDTNREIWSRQQSTQSDKPMLNLPHIPVLNSVCLL
ncbi:hypothetical protein V6N13_143944 [Hibiscus sabdariffa]|uniref:Uncharacterized protein n=1 Tax=Hibiscus sabdariffa TaxID=183260 RepID=A0ABR2FIW5_9ROSI